MEPRDVDHPIDEDGESDMRTRRGQITQRRLDIGSHAAGVPEELKNEENSLRQNLEYENRRTISQCPREERKLQGRTMVSACVEYIQGRPMMQQGPRYTDKDRLPQGTYRRARDTRGEESHHLNAKRALQESTCPEWSSRVRDFALEERLDSVTSDESDGEEGWNRSYHGGLDQYHGNYSRNRGRSLPLTALLQCIPTFSGESENLGTFCTAIRRIAETLDGAAQRQLILYIANKLKGHAFDHFFSKMGEYGNVEELITALTERYVSIGSVDILYGQLKEIAQREEETVDVYAQRVLRLSKKIMAIYDCAPDIEARDRGSRKRGVAADAMENFLFGLKGKLESQVRSKGPRTLEEAVRIAVEFENKQYTRTMKGTSVENTGVGNSQGNHTVRRLMADDVWDNSEHLGTDSRIMKMEAVDARILEQNSIRARTQVTRDTVCGFCRNTGHTQEECPRRRQSEQECQFCGRKGHKWKECRTWRREIMEMVGTNQRGPGPSTRYGGPSYRRDDRGPGYGPRGYRDANYSPRNFGARREGNYAGPYQARNNGSYHRGPENMNTRGPTDTMPPRQVIPSQDARVEQEARGGDIISQPLN